MKSVIHLNTNLQLFDFLHLAGQNWILKKKKEQEVSNEIEILWIHMKSGINDVHEWWRDLPKPERDKKKRTATAFIAATEPIFAISVWVFMVGLLLLALKSCFYWSWTRRCNSLALRGSQRNAHLFLVYNVALLNPLSKCCKFFSFSNYI